MWDAHPKQVHDEMGYEREVGRVTQHQQGSDSPTAREARRSVLGQHQPAQVQSRAEAAPEIGQEVAWDLDAHWPFDDTPYNVYQQLDYDIDRSIRYHGLREAFFDKAHRLIQVVSLLTTTTAVVALYGEEGLVGKILAAIAALGQTVDMFFALEQRAKEHRELRARFQVLRGEMVAQKATPEAVRHWTKKRFEIEADEGPTRAVLNAKAANAAMKAREIDEGDLLHVGWIQSLFAQFVDLWPTRITANRRRLRWRKRRARGDHEIQREEAKRLPPPERQEPEPESTGQ